MIQTRRIEHPTPVRLQGERRPHHHQTARPQFPGQDDCSTTKPLPSRPTPNVKLRSSIVNLRRTIASAVSHAPVKEVARDFGISPREVNILRTETGFPRVPIFLEIARRDPQLRAQVMAILCGEAEAGSMESVNALVSAAIGR